MTTRRLSLASFAAAAGLVLSLWVAVAPASAALEAPQNVRGVISTQTRLQIAWDQVDGATHYQVNFASNPNFTGGVIAKPIANTTYVLPDLTSAKLSPGTTYYFKVGAVSSAGAPLSGWSETKSYATKPLMKISVASYNVKDPDSESFNDRFGAWDVRGPRAAAAIIGQGVRLFGIQEVYDRQDRTTMLEFVNRQAGGGSNYRMVPDADSSAGEDSRILFDQRVFRHVSSGGVVYQTQNGSEERGFSWGKFQHSASGQYVLFVTTHLSPRSDTVDIAQWKQLIGWLNSVRKANPAYKFIVTGDFNATKFEQLSNGQPVAQLAAMRSYGFEDVLGQIFRSYSTYRNPSVRYESWICSSNQQLRDVRAPNCSVSPGRNSNSIDYIFVSKVLKATYYRVYAAPRTGYVMNYLTSDHYLVRATISQ